MVDGISGEAGSVTLAKNRAPETLVAPGIVFSASMALLTAVGIGVRLIQLDSQSFWAYEGFTAFHALLPFWSIPAELAALDSHPPLHYLMLSLWGSAAGTTEFSFRIVSVFAGAATIPLIGILGYRFFNRATGVAAATLLILSPFHVWYSQEARMYALLTFFVLGALLLLHMAIVRAPGADQASRSRSAVYWIGHAILVTLALYSHYYGLFVIPLGLAMLFLTKPSGRRWSETIKPWLLANLASLAIFALWVPAILDQFGRAEGGFSPNLSLPQVLAALINTFAVGEYAWFDQSLIVALALGGLAIAGAAFAGFWGRKDRGAAVLLLIWLVGPPLIALAMTLVLGIDVRATGRMYYLFCLPAFLILIGRSLSAITLNQPFFSLLGAVAVTALFLPSLGVQFTAVLKEDFREAGRLVSRWANPADSVILNAESIYTAFDYYYAGPTPWRRASVGRLPETEAWIESATKDRERAWLVLSHAESADPESQVAGWFERNGRLLEEHWLTGIRVALYSLEPRPNYEPPVIALDKNVRFANGIDLLGYELDVFDPNRHAMPVKLFWHNGRSHDTTYRAVLQLVDDAGTVWAQSDRSPIAGQYPTPEWQAGEFLTDYVSLALPPGLPPVTYELRLFLYDEGDGRRIPVSGAASGSTSDIVLDRVAVGVLDVLPADVVGQSVARSFRTSVGEVATIVGGSFPEQPVNPGFPIEMSLLWEIARPPTQTQFFAVRFTGANGRGEAEIPLFNERDIYPPSRWGEMQLVRTHHRVLVPAELDAGTYELAIVLNDSAKPEATESGTVALLQVREPDRVFDAAFLPTRVNASFANLIQLTSFDISETVLSPGQATQVSLQWKALAPMRESYSVFVHLLDASGAIVAQSDGLPGSPPRATSTWIRDEIVLDRRSIMLGPDVPLGLYRLAVGLYDPISGTRIQLTLESDDGGSDKLILPQELVVGGSG